MRFELVGQQNATLLGNRWDPLLAIALLVRDLVPGPQESRSPACQVSLATTWLSDRASAAECNTVT